MNRIAAILLGIAALASYANAQSPAAPTPDSPSCLKAMQVIGHNGEYLLSDWNLANETGHDLDATLAMAQAASMYVDIARKVVANEQALCDRVNTKMDRTYPARLDEHDQMSTGRLMMVMGQLRIVASTKARLEAEASKDISH
jgi:hypothetical protein